MAIEQLAEEVVNEVANNLEEAAEVTRKLNAAGLGYFSMGLGVGVAVGFYFGYKFNREKLRSEAFEEAEAEVAQLREVYLQKSLSVVNLEKPPAEEIVQELGLEDKVEQLGYGIRVPPGLENITQTAGTTAQRPLRPPVPMPLDDLPENPVGTSKSMNAGWDAEKEKRERSPDLPYVIHQNEYTHSEPEYEKLSYTYWALDDVVTEDESERPVPHGDVVVGLHNLRFGHGADDVNVVHVRNDRFEQDMKIRKVDRSFEDAILGSDVGTDGNHDDEDD